MSFIKKLSAFSVVGLFALSVLAVPLAFAQNQQGGNGLQISPTRTDITAQPGENKEFTVSLKNITEQKLKLTAELNDFESDNETGSPQIIIDENRERTPYTLDGILNGLSDLELKPGETKNVKLSLDVPGDAVAGAYFGAIRYQAVPGQDLNEDQRQIALNASVAHLVFLEVPGDVVQQIEVQNLGVLRVDGQDTNDGGLFFQSPNKATIKLKNLGNGFSRPFGSVQIKYGSSEVYSYDVNSTDPRGTILPNSSRVFTDDISNIKKPGKYTITAGVTYGSGGEVAEYTSTFWYLPFWFLGLLAVVIILLVVGGFYGYRKLANRK